MVNMSYCKFRNTLAAIKECDELFEADVDMNAELSEDEFRALKRMVSLLEDVDLGRLGDIIQEVEENRE